MTGEEDLGMYQLAQTVTDEYLGEGAYVALNHFDPSKGETPATLALRRMKEFHDALSG